MTDMKSEEVRDNLGLPQPIGRAENFYNTLNVHPEATRLEIRESYLRLKTTYGPGSAALYSLMSDEEARESMERVEEAFRVLNDEVARRQYDARHNIEVAKSRSEFGRQESMTIDLQAERLANARNHEANWGGDFHSGREFGGEGFVRTVRSTLPIIKTRAGHTQNEETQTRYGDIIEESDPGDGDLFRRLREVAQVSPEELQERTKISVGYIEALEANRFDQLPQLIYVKGFLRSYLKYLHVPDAERLVNAFAKRLADWQDNQKK